MAKIIPIKVTNVSSSGKLIEGGTWKTLHGWILTETAGHNDTLDFCSKTTEATLESPADSTAPVLFTRSLTASTDLPPFLDHQGFEMEGGIFIKTAGSGTVSGVILVS